MHFFFPTLNPKQFVGRDSPPPFLKTHGKREKNEFRERERERERESSKEDAFDSKKRRLDFERRRRRDPPPPPITHALCRTHIHTHTHIPKEERITHHKSFRRLCEEKIECISISRESK